MYYDIFILDAPEVYVEPTAALQINEFDDFKIKCYVQSAVPIIVQWKQYNQILTEIEAE